MYLSGFRSQLPRFQCEQSEGLKWLAWLHERFAGPDAPPFEKLFNRFGCGSDRIASRAYESADYRQFTDAAVKRFSSYPVGERMAFFSKVANERLDELYESVKHAPDLLIHVTCTGYVAPSPAQLLLLRKGWHQSTEILHAYHMGCYAALPAVREALHRVRGGCEDGRVDIVHNELCTLHLNPHLHTPEQFVVQSLFADGHIGYSMTAKKQDRSLQVLAVREELVPDSAAAMTWNIGDQNFDMTLAREIPELIQGAIGGFLERLAKDAGLRKDETQKAIYAIHPGGPRIIDLLADRLRLDESQIASSRKILRNRGNMSSATLPHIWSDLITPGGVEAGRLIVSLAFGPGLTIFGSVMRSC